MSLLIADSGSTKTDWCLLKKGKKPVYFRTSGINPALQSKHEIIQQLQNELSWNHSVHKVNTISYYGAGSGASESQGVIKQALVEFFRIKNIEVQSDLLAAARSLCGDKSGVVSILGTGSNCCYYNGRVIKEQQVSLGYIAGDEGSGNQMGKRILQYYAYNTFDADLKQYFEKLFGNDISTIIKKLYGYPFPNRQLAAFVQLLIDNRGHYMVENIIEDCINDFFHNHILKFRQSWKLPLYFIGSIAYGFRDVIAELCNQYELTLGTIEKSPMDGLLKYHRKLL
jgi:N-acetylglucosamine kinase-like BadF-type ATPase